MKTLSQKQMDALIDVGKRHGCELLLPPFNGSYNPFFCIKDIKGKAIAFRDFLVDIKKTGVFYKFVILDEDPEKNFIEIMAESEVNGER